MPIFKAIYKKLSGKWHPQAVTVGSVTQVNWSDGTGGEGSVELQ